MCINRLLFVSCQLGERGESGQSSASAMDRRGVLFQNLVTRDAVGCWNSARPYTRAALGEVQKDHRRLSFPNDLKVDNEEPQNLWVLSNKLHDYLYRSLDPQVSVSHHTLSHPNNLKEIPVLSWSHNKVTLRKSCYSVYAREYLLQASRAFKITNAKKWLSFFRFRDWDQFHKSH